MFPEDKTSILGTRLKLARKMAGLSLQDLSDKLGNLVTKQSLNKYEAGLMNPTPEVLLAISKALGVKLDYFSKKDIAELGQISFRKKASLSKRDEEIIIEKSRNYFERYSEIESILAIKGGFSNPLSALSINTYDDVENAALRLREVWELGLSPISNLVEMLETKGVRVFLYRAVEEIDGFATMTAAGIPFVMVNTQSRPVERVRFTAIHELAHILLNLGDEIRSNHNLEENYCHYFSSCFILPQKQLIQRIGEKRDYIKINELVNIKEHYGISIRAIIHRLKKIEVITPTYYDKWMVYLSKTYTQKGEPGEYKMLEKASHFDQLIYRALAEGLISISKAASLSDKSINEFRTEDAN